MQIPIKILEYGAKNFVAIRKDRNGRTNSYPTAQQAVNALLHSRPHSKLARRLVRKQLPPRARYTWRQQRNYIGMEVQSVRRVA